MKKEAKLFIEKIKQVMQHYKINLLSCEVNNLVDGNKIDLSNKVHFTLFFKDELSMFKAAELYSNPSSQRSISKGFSKNLDCFYVMIK